MHLRLCGEKPRDWQLQLTLRRRGETMQRLRSHASAQHVLRTPLRIPLPLTRCKLWLHLRCVMTTSPVLFGAADTLFVLLLKDAEIAQLRMALANRPFTSVISGTGRDGAEGEARAMEAEARAARAERALAVSRAVEAELSSLLLAERRREAATGRDVASSPAGARATVARGSAVANSPGPGSLHSLNATRPREGRLSHVNALLSAALEAQ